MKQKQVFLQSEGDAWFTRNQHAVAIPKLPYDDPILREIIDTNINVVKGRKLRVLEVGCGDGTRLAWLKNNLDADCYGIEPSFKAVEVACAKGVNAQQGTANILPYDDLSFDIVIFGFCLYLCDREDLFRIASEANRVLRMPGWLIILDFYDPTPSTKDYHHRPGLLSYKMDYRTLFTWHPDYECMTHKVRHHSEGGHTDERDEWVAISILRKHQEALNT
jgi:ubiquinone/menaquinone biosynthesis C-methylase UbiE